MGKSLVELIESKLSSNLDQREIAKIIIEATDVRASQMVNNSVSQEELTKTFEDKVKEVATQKVEMASVEGAQNAKQSLADSVKRKSPSLPYPNITSSTRTRAIGSKYIEDGNAVQEVYDRAQSSYKDLIKKLNKKNEKNIKTLGKAIEAHMSEQYTRSAASLKVNKGLEINTSNEGKIARAFPKNSAVSKFFTTYFKTGSSNSQYKAQYYDNTMSNLKTIFTSAQMLDELRARRRTRPNVDSSMYIKKNNAYTRINDALENADIDSQMSILSKDILDKVSTIRAEMLPSKKKNFQSTVSGLYTKNRESGKISWNTDKMFEDAKSKVVLSKVFGIDINDYSNTPTDIKRLTKELDTGLKQLKEMDAFFDSIIKKATLSSKEKALANSSKNTLLPKLKEDGSLDKSVNSVYNQIGKLDNRMNEFPSTWEKVMTPKGRNGSELSYDVYEEEYEKNLGEINDILFQLQSIINNQTYSVNAQGTNQQRYENLLKLKSDENFKTLNNIRTAITKDNDGSVIRQNTADKFASHIYQNKDDSDTYKKFWDAVLNSQITTDNIEKIYGSIDNDHPSESAELQKNVDVLKSLINHIFNLNSDKDRLNYVDLQKIISSMQELNEAIAYESQKNNISKGFSDLGEDKGSEYIQDAANEIAKTFQKIKGVTGKISSENLYNEKIDFTSLSEFVNNIEYLVNSTGMSLEELFNTLNIQVPGMSTQEISEATRSMSSAIQNRSALDEIKNNEDKLLRIGEMIENGKNLASLESEEAQEFAKVADQLGITVEDLYGFIQKDKSKNNVAPSKSTVTSQSEDYGSGLPQGNVVGAAPNAEIKTEISDLQAVEQAVRNVKVAVDAKTEAFVEEAKAVHNSVEQEVVDLETLKNKIIDIVKEIESCLHLKLEITADTDLLSKVTEQIKLDVKELQNALDAENFNTALSKLNLHVDIIPRLINGEATLQTELDSYDLTVNVTPKIGSSNKALQDSVSSISKINDGKMIQPEALELLKTTLVEALTPFTKLDRKVNGFHTNLKKSETALKNSSQYITKLAEQAEKLRVALSNMDWSSIPKTDIEISVTPKLSKNQFIKDLRKAVADSVTNANPIIIKTMPNVSGWKQKIKDNFVNGKATEIKVVPDVSQQTVNSWVSAINRALKPYKFEVDIIPKSGGKNKSSEPKDKATKDKEAADKREQARIHNDDRKNRSDLEKYRIDGKLVSKGAQLKDVKDDFAYQTYVNFSNEILNLQNQTKDGEKAIVQLSEDEVKTQRLKLALAEQYKKIVDYLIKVSTMHPDQLSVLNNNLKSQGSYGSFADLKNVIDEQLKGINKKITKKEYQEALGAFSDVGQLIGQFNHAYYPVPKKVRTQPVPGRTIAQISENGIPINGLTDGQVYDALEKIRVAYSALGDAELKYAAGASQASIIVKGAGGALTEYKFKIDKTSNAIVELNDVTREATTGFYGSVNNLGKGFGRVFSYLSSFGSVYELWARIKEGAEYIKTYDKALIEMRKVSDETIGTLKAFQKESFNIANAVATTGEVIQNSTADWMRLGESLAQAKKSAEQTAVLFNVSEFSSIEEATEALVSMSQAYKELGKDEIVDIVNIVGEIFA